MGRRFSLRHAGQMDAIASVGKAGGKRSVLLFRMQMILH